MKLGEYLDATQMNAKHFSKESGIDIQTIRNILKGYTVTLENAVKIESFTRGAVKPKELLPSSVRQRRQKTSEGTSLDHQMTCETSCSPTNPTLGHV